MTTGAVRPIDGRLLDEVSGEAAASPRRRKNRNFHPADDFPAHRLLNGVEPGSYILPHRHLDPAKDESIIVLRGRFGAIEFDDAGGVKQALLLDAGGDLRGIDIPHGIWHTLVSLAPGSVFFEAKAGPFVPLLESEKAPWAPAEGSEEAHGRVNEYCRLFGVMGS